MDFGSPFTEDDQMSKANKLPFSYSSSSSPSSSSSHHHKLTQIYDNPQHHHQMASWLGTKYETAQEDTSTGANKLDLMDVNDDEDQSVAVVEKEHMFDKVVTPSDVGKLNRLVIPKQHAEKYFPLDSSTNEKGLLLNFEDRTRKAWRFRYSYWNSSQSYVMTKGWSRFVKDKKLDAGDIVSFQRGMGDSGKDRLYIDWRRRPDAPDPTSHNQHRHLSSIPWSPLLMRPPAVPMVPRDHLHLSNPNRNMYNYNIGYGYAYSSSNSSSTGTIVYMRSAAPQQVGTGMVQRQQGGGGGFVEPMVYESVPVVQGKAALKRLRLFGVNMDCLIMDSQECDKIMSSPLPIAIPSSSSTMAQLSSASHNPLQLRHYNGTQLPPPPTQFLHKGKSSMSLDLEI
ncbi:hypothetical protein JCGZ_20332 [Jatropha curcas]|uniref:TF-B3 domain-containing protein n=1 Tax=Jatropha curcas TaxID=180498 RepID=A0A067JMG9_JATCU|nr:B3 domain-containing transcription factor NGA1 [Jatropha curcas]KDP25176.1 hypothetical protein JCGZ_20332 [Jatropha curcas]